MEYVIMKRYFSCLRNKTRIIVSIMIARIAVAISTVLLISSYYYILRMNHRSGIRQIQWIIWLLSLITILSIFVFGQIGDVHINHKSERDLRYLSDIILCYGMNKKGISKLKRLYKKRIDETDKSYKKACLFIICLLVPGMVVVGCMYARHISELARKEQGIDVRLCIISYIALAVSFLVLVLGIIIYYSRRLSVRVKYLRMLKDLDSNFFF